MQNDFTCGLVDFWVFLMKSCIFSVLLFICSGRGPVATSFSRADEGSIVQSDSFVADFSDNVWELFDDDEILFFCEKPRIQLFKNAIFDRYIDVLRPNTERLNNICLFHLYLPPPFPFS